MIALRLLMNQMLTEVIQSDMMQDIIEQLKELLFGKCVMVDDLKKCLEAQGYDSEMINAIILEMLRVPGFSFMNDTVTYRGADYVAKMPPNQSH